MPRKLFAGGVSLPLSNPFLITFDTALSQKTKWIAAKTTQSQIMNSLSMKQNKSNHSETEILGR